MRWRVGGGVEVGMVVERRDWIVEVTKAPICGQTRGWREEQRMTPIEGGGGGGGGGGDDMTGWFDMLR